MHMRASWMVRGILSLFAGWCNGCNRNRRSKLFFIWALFFLRDKKCCYAVTNAVTILINRPLEAGVYFIPIFVLLHMLLHSRYKLKMLLHYSYING